MIKIRKYEAGDGDAVRGLIASVMREEFPQSLSAFPLNDLDDIPGVYGSLGEAFFVAVNGERLVGTAAVKREDERVALLRRIFVDTTHRQQNIGIRLVEYAIQFCREVGYQEVVFKSSSKMDAAIRLCSKIGFVQRAKIRVGELELLKFVLMLKDHPAGTPR